MKNEERSRCTGTHTHTVLQEISQSSIRKKHLTLSHNHLYTHHIRTHEEAAATRCSLNDSIVCKLMLKPQKDEYQTRTKRMQHPAAPLAALLVYIALVKSKRKHAQASTYTYKHTHKHTHTHKAHNNTHQEAAAPCCPPGLVRW